MSIFTIDEQALEHQRATEAVAIREVAQSAAITIRTPDEVEKAVAALGDVSARRKALEARRKDTKAPMLEAGRRIDQLFKELDAPLAEAEASLKTGIKVWRDAERKQIEAQQCAEEERRRAEFAAAEEKRREEEAQARAEREAAARAAAKAEADVKKGDRDAERRVEAAKRAEEQARIREMVAKETQPVVATAIAPVSEQASQIKTADVTVSVRKVWKFEVEDASRVPSAYRVVDERLIRKAVSEGVRDIPGVRIFEDEQIATRAA
jgi:colicin import membrane protein